MKNIIEFEANFDEREFTMEEDEQWEAFMSFIRECEHEREKRGKAVVINPEKIQILKEVLHELKYLLAENRFDYKLEIEKCDFFDTSLYISITLESFGVAPKDHRVFEKLISMIRGFSTIITANDKLRIEMAINDMFIRVK